MPWITRGLRNGVVTTRYPRRPDDYGDGYRGSVRVADRCRGEEGQTGDGNRIGELCPTGAISHTDSGPSVNRGACILCGRCVAAQPATFSFDPSPFTASLSRRALTVPTGMVESDECLAAARKELAARVGALRRSVYVRHVDAGSDGSEEWEIAALTNPVYDVQRLGIFFTASPRHADVLLVTGAGAAGMAVPVAHTYAVMPDPKVVVAAGTDAVSGGLFAAMYAAAGGVGTLVPVDVWIPGSPPSPFAVLQGILLAVGLLRPEPVG